MMYCAWESLFAAESEEAGHALVSTAWTAASKQDRASGRPVRVTSVACTPRRSFQRYGNLPACVLHNVIVDLGNWTLNIRRRSTPRPPASSSAR